MTRTGLKKFLLWTAGVIGGSLLLWGASQLLSLAAIKLFPLSFIQCSYQNWRADLEFGLTTTKAFEIRSHARRIEYEIADEENSLRWHNRRFEQRKQDMENSYRNYLKRVKVCKQARLLDGNTFEEYQKLLSEKYLDRLDYPPPGNATAVAAYENERDRLIDAVRTHQDAEWCYEFPPDLNTTKHTNILSDTEGWTYEESRESRDEAWRDISASQGRIQDLKRELNSLPDFAGRLKLVAALVPMCIESIFLPEQITILQEYLE